MIQLLDRLQDSLYTFKYFQIQQSYFSSQLGTNWKHTSLEEDVLRSRTKHATSTNIQMWSRLHYITLEKIELQWESTVQFICRQTCPVKPCCIILRCPFLSVCGNNLESVESSLQIRQESESSRIDGGWCNTTNQEWQGPWSLLYSPVKTCWSTVSSPSITHKRHN